MRGVVESGGVCGEREYLKYIVLSFNPVMNAIFFFFFGLSPGVVACFALEQRFKRRGCIFGQFFVFVLAVISALCGGSCRFLPFDLSIVERGV